MRILLAVLAIALPLACTCPPSPESPAASPPTSTARPAPGPAPVGRTPAFAPGSDHYARVEGTGFQNACSTDADCHTGGCSSEVCSAQPDVSSTCEMPEAGWPSQGKNCGCVAGQCSWYGDAAPASSTTPVASPAPAASTPPSPAPKPAPAPPSNPDAPVSSPTAPVAQQPLPGQGKPCASGNCAGGLTCVSYYGIAGPRGPKFTSCEIPCAKSSCPAGQTCRTIADGPGPVCR